MPEGAEYILVGGGLAAASAARAINKADPEGRILLLTAEDELPYHRPPLSKQYLKGETERDRLLVQSPAWYEKRGIEVRTRSRVEALDPAAHRLILADGQELEYGRCLLATGGRARPLDLPGADREGIHTLRDVGDSERIRDEIESAGSAVVVGASFIGMELASAFAQAGLETTVMELAPRVWPKITDEQVAGFFQNYFEERGVRFVLGDGPAVFEGNGNGRVTGVRTGDDRRVACEFVTVGVGIRLNLDFLEDSGIEVEDGVVVDDRLRSSAEDVYAAGDIANFPDVTLGKRMRIEHWDNAKAQGAHAGANMVGADEAYEHMSYFFSDVFDLSLNVVGDLDDYDRVVIRGTLDDASFLAFYLREGIVRAALMVDREWPELEAAKKLIRQRASVEAEKLADPSVGLEELAGVS